MTLSSLAAHAEADAPPINEPPPSPDVPLAPAVPPASQPEALLTPVDTPPLAVPLTSVVALAPRVGKIVRASLKS
jgi:hypothetical protein